MIFWILLILVLNYILGFFFIADMAKYYTSKMEAKFFSLYPLWGGISAVLLLSACVIGLLYEAGQEIFYKVREFKEGFIKLCERGWM